MNKKIKYTLIGCIVLVVLALFAGFYFLQHKNPQPVTALISYTNTGFQPNTITVESQTIITFRNDSSKSFQPVSDRGYGGYQCTNDEYGACQSIPPGGSWSATFDTANGGGWPYHDSLNPSAKVNIVVTVHSGEGIPLNDNPPLQK